ncbi:hypothetical protein GIB67_041314 [Kingdonia uniflora]|uniref:Uncharacterized protein n=1 Tax=Kingdonia uniflora TaxID=39325 RepID=A0A7J7NIL4_9MAGN|nr:hypothetical protein GIB67_041314 [Kingdonia uniflora]
MSDIVGINKVISPSSGIVVKTLCTVPIEVVPPLLTEQPDIVMIEPDEGPPICPTSQVKVEVETTQFDSPQRLKEKEYEEIGGRRPRKQRIPDPDKEKRQKRYGKCRVYDHNKKTCKGAPTTPRPRVARTPKKVDINVSMARHISCVGLPSTTPNMRRRGSGGIGGGGRKSSRGVRTETSSSPRYKRAMIGGPQSNLDVPRIWWSVKATR